MRRTMLCLAVVGLLVIAAGIVSASGTMVSIGTVSIHEAVLGVLGTGVMIAVGRRLQRPVTVRRYREFGD